MPNEKNRYYEMRRLGVVFACASAALLVSMLWWIWVDLTPAWKTHQNELARARAALRRLDELTEGKPQMRPAELPADGTGVRQVTLPLIRRDLHFVQTATTDRCITCHAAIDDENMAPWRLAVRMGTDGVDRTGKTEGQTSPGNSPLRPPLGEGGSGELSENVFGGIDWLWPMLSEERQRSVLSDAINAANRRLEADGKTPIAVNNPIQAHPRPDLYVADDSPHPMKKMGCTVCHEGNGDETDFVLAGHPKDTAAEARGSMERPMLPTRHTEASCAKCHPQISDTAMRDCRPLAPTLNQGRILVERWGCVNCHLIEGFENAPRVGPSLAKANATLDGQFFAEYVLSPHELRPWTTMPQSFRQENNLSQTTDGTDGDTRARAEIDAMWAYLSAVSQDDPSDQGRNWPEEWAKPEFMAKAKEQGRRLFNEIGCLACHPPVERRSGPYGTVASRPADLRENSEGIQTGRYHRPSPDDVEALVESTSDTQSAIVRYAPDLSNMGGELRGGPWIREWLIDPTRYLPGSRMPRLRLTPLPASAPAAPTGVPDEATSLAIYISSLQTGQTPLSGPSNTTSTGREILDTTRTTIIREIIAAGGETDDGEISTQLQAASSDNKIAAERIAAMPPDERRWLFAGQRLLAHYGCSGCHRMPGLENAARIGPELTRWADKPAGQLDLGQFDPLMRRTLADEEFKTLYPPGNDQPWSAWAPSNDTVDVERTHVSFARHKLLNPRMWDRGLQKSPLSRLRMPNFFMSYREADSLTTFVLSRRAANVDASLIVSDQSPAGVATKGRNLARSLNCTACHVIDGNNAAIRQYYQRQEGDSLRMQEAEAPPRLPAHGARVTAQWTYEYMSDVATIRPWLKVRMPSFSLSDEQSTLLAEYFAAVSQEQSRWLGDKLATIASARKDSRTGSEAAASAVDSIRRFALLHGSIPPGWLDPLSARREVFTKACDQAVTDAGFLQGVYASGHAFLDPPAQTASADRVADGRTLFQELQCLQCHVFGDPAAPGANTHPTAPDLQSVNSRLRRKWVASWLQDPPRIQPGTRMPRFFGDGRAGAFADYEPADRAEIEARLRHKTLINDGPEQIQAIVSFVYDASSRRLDVTRDADTQPADQ